VRRRIRATGYRRVCERASYRQVNLEHKKLSGFYVQERLLEVIVGLGGDVVVLQVLLTMEGDGLSLDFALLDVDLVAAQNNRDVLADTDEIT
jgi:hypothetical protein